MRPSYMLAGARSLQVVHQPNQLGAAPFDFKAMPPRHLLQVIAHRAARRRQRERLLYPTRDPLLAMNQQVQALAQGAGRRELGSKRPGIRRRRPAVSTDQAFEVT